MLQQLREMIPLMIRTALLRHTSATLWGHSRRFSSMPLSRIAVFDGPEKPLRYLDLPIPKLKTGEVVVAMRLATICGSDLHTIMGLRTEPTPSVLGHEGVGSVLAVRDRNDVAVGARVSWSIADACGRCAPCADLHLPQKCKSLFKYGHAAMSNGTGLNGTYATHVVLRPGTHIVSLPDSVSDTLAAPANCALATVCATLDEEDGGMPVHGPRKSALVQGAGLLGLYSCALLKHQLGFQTVYCTVRNLRRAELVKQFGGTPLLTTEGAQQRTKAEILKSYPSGVDLVVEVTGDASVMREGLNVIRYGGHYALAGMVHPQTRLDAIKGEDIIRRCITIRGTHNYAPKHLDQAISFLARFAGRLPFESLLSPPLPLSQLEKAIEQAKSKAYPRIAVSFPKIPS